MIGSIIGYIIIGAIIGVVARLALPGRQNIGMALTIVLGIVGALAGGWITHAVLNGKHNIISFIVSVVVAAILVGAVAGSSRSRAGRV